MEDILDSAAQSEAEEQALLIVDLVVFPMLAFALGVLGLVWFLHALNLASNSLTIQHQPRWWRAASMLTLFLLACFRLLILLATVGGTTVWDNALRASLYLLCTDLFMIITITAMFSSQRNKKNFITEEAENVFCCTIFLTCTIVFVLGVGDVLQFEDKELAGMIGLVWTWVLLLGLESANNHSHNNNEEEIEDFDELNILKV